MLSISFFLQQQQNNLSSCAATQRMHTWHCPGTRGGHWSQEEFILQDLLRPFQEVAGQDYCRKRYSVALVDIILQCSDSLDYGPMISATVRHLFLSQQHPLGAYCISLPPVVLFYVLYNNYICYLLFSSWLNAG